MEVLHKEQMRRLPLIAHARHLAAQLPYIPQGTPRYTEVTGLLAQVDRELHKLPSGAHDGRTRRLY